MDVYRAAVIFFNSNVERWTFVCLVFNIMLVTVLFLFQKLAINNTLTSKVCSCDFIH